jgi:phage terminase large subunit-like protein
VPRDSIRDRARRDKAPYDQWAPKGIITAMAGPTVDYEIVRAVVVGWCTEFAVQFVAYDPWNATDLVSRLEKQDNVPCIPMRQTYAALSAPTKSLEKAILGRQLRHDGDPVLRWCMSNVAVETDPAGNLKPSKTASTERIDAVVALIMAVDLMDRNAAAGPSYSMLVMG